MGGFFGALATIGRSFSLPPAGAPSLRAALEARKVGGAAPVHTAFLHGQVNIGKELILRYPACAAVTYGNGPFAGEQGPLSG